MCVCRPAARLLLVLIGVLFLLYDAALASLVVTAREGTGTGDGAVVVVVGRVFRWRRADRFTTDGGEGGAGGGVRESVACTGCVHYAQ